MLDVTQILEAAKHMLLLEECSRLDRRIIMDSYGIDDATPAEARVLIAGIQHTYNVIQRKLTLAGVPVWLAKVGGLGDYLRGE